MRAARVAEAGASDPLAPFRAALLQVSGLGQHPALPR